MQQSILVQGQSQRQLLTKAQRVTFLKLQTSLKLACEAVRSYVSTCWVSMLHDQSTWPYAPANGVQSYVGFPHVHLMTLAFSQWCLQHPTFFSALFSLPISGALIESVDALGCTRLVWCWFPINLLQQLDHQESVTSQKAVLATFPINAQAKIEFSHCRLCWCQVTFVAPITFGLRWPHWSIWENMTWSGRAYTLYQIGWVSSTNTLKQEVQSTSTYWGNYSINIVLS